ncbi:MAG: hypothetical protein A2X59_07985 [Nitrospirae bacterium GWC2_42_7]|nr:MAG: hypothetical protein A2X59_07985 [Nitrospirae bacterium GWC2_42_7]
MKDKQSNKELHHEIFGSILDRTEMTPFNLLPARDYATALSQAAKMMSNRGFDILDNTEIHKSEKERADRYIERVYRYFLHWLFPFVSQQLEELAALQSANEGLYWQCLDAIGEIEAVLMSTEFRQVISEDPRHLFLFASSRRYPHVFYGYKGSDLDIPASWQQVACSMLKMGYLIKSVEEDSQDINDYAQLGFFLEAQGQSLDDLYWYGWDNAKNIPDNESAKRAFVKVSTFIYKLKDSMTFNENEGCLVFNSGDGVSVDIIEIKTRLKSPESMFTKLAKEVGGEAYGIFDILAITFILKNIDDTLKLFHALQKRGIVLHENITSHSITQTLFESPQSMKEAVRRLMVSLAESGGSYEMPPEEDIFSNAGTFYETLSVNAAKNPHSSVGHRKFQCKIAFSLPVHYTAETNEIMIPGTPVYKMRERISKKTQQHTLGVELRISDEQNWLASELKGDSHHDAYKFRQLISVMNKVFSNRFLISKENLAQLRRDQGVIFP